MKRKSLIVLGINFLTVIFLAVTVNLFADDTIKHKFLLLDESRKQILLVDQFEPKNDWVIKLTDGGVWDLQLIGGHKLLVALTDKGGFREYDLRTRQVVREVADAKYKQTMTAIRFQDGKTLLGCNKSKAYQFYLLDADGKLINELPAESKKKSIRIARRTSRGTILFGCNDNWVNEIDLTGKVLREFKVPGSRHIYHVMEKPDGNLLVAGGYGCFVAEYDKDNKEVRKWGGLPAPDGLTFIFFSKMQILKNGNLVVATWTGHGANDSKKGIQLVEFDANGKVVWTWHNPKLAGSINNIIVLDDLDTNNFYE
ncbi:MAG: aryl-sulfate sulfotransferase [Planctomycetaceae bacterium]|jgi:outer membrane protein assembly factor BamB|nr:aryl-sulfate sulfotransferase [Planctomycetaceae bacterium]